MCHSVNNCSLFQRYFIAELGILRCQFLQKWENLGCITFSFTKNPKYYLIVIKIADSILDLELNLDKSKTSKYDKNKSIKINIILYFFAWLF